MDVLLLTAPEEHPLMRRAADALAGALGERGQRVARQPGGAGDVAVLGLELEEALRRSDLLDHELRSFMLVEDAPSSLGALPDAARRARAAREAGHRFKIDHWVLTGAQSEKSVWEFDHHCAPCRIDWAVSSEEDALGRWASEVIDQLGLAPAPTPIAAPMPSKLGFPGSLPAQEASKFTYVFDAQELAGVSGDIMPTRTPPVSSAPAHPKSEPRGALTDSTSSRKMGLALAALFLVLAAVAGALFLL